MDSSRINSDTGYRLPKPGRYVERIGIEWPFRSDLETLDRQILAHQRSVLFENLDCYDSRVTSVLDLVSLYDKVVVHDRGVYYFELNALFLALLRDIGFDARVVSSCVFRDKGLIRN